jgi:ligand-binding sensor domain-containing protein
VRLLLLISLLSFTHKISFSQEQNYSAFIVKDGLPSNHVYRVVEDNHGFLWIATDAGIARFDGKFFQVFTTAEGLPDNEVLSVVKEKNGRIWVNCFKQSPAYFDETRNRFINASEDSLLSKVSGTTGMLLVAPPGGGVIYYTQKGNFIFRDGRLEILGKEENAQFYIKRIDNNNYLQWRSGVIRNPEKHVLTGIYLTRGKELIDSSTLVLDADEFPSPSLNNGMFYLFRPQKNCFHIYRNFSTAPLQFRLDTIYVPEKFVHFDFTQTSLYIIGGSGKIYVYDKLSGKLLKVFAGNYLPNSYYNDSMGNEWISTIGKGLLVYRKNRFTKLPLPVEFDHRNFLSIYSKDNGTIYAGNFYGEVIESGRKGFSVHKISNYDISRQRKIIMAAGKIFTFSDLGSYVNYTIPIYNQETKPTPHPAKTAILLNDTTIMIGFSAGLLKLDTRSLEVKRVKMNYLRITSLAQANDSIVYFGSTDGLYSLNFKTDSLQMITACPPLRITGLTYTPDQLLWVTTGGEGLLVMKNDKPLTRITSDQGLIDNSIRCITNANPGAVWLGTSHGISILNYRLTKSSFEYTFQNVSVNDGLSGNEINEMYFRNDTMYAATGDGITLLPSKIPWLPTAIPLYVTGIKVNGVDMPIQTNYELDSKEQSISIRVAGIDLAGHFKKMEYMLDDDGNWISSSENTLNFRLGHGHHQLKLRALDVNGRVSNRVLTLYFLIATPFWKTLWFWIITGIIIQAAVIYSVWHLVRTRRKSRLARQIAGVQNASLEQQAFTSLMNPHFMFNALNSVQHYINLQDRQNANRYLTDFASLIRKNFEAAQQSFIPLEQELENIKIYLRLEQMRFSGRFSYEVNILDNVDVEQWMMPTMVLQPLLENSLLHGLMPSAINGTLELKISERKSYLEVSITDNGIGMKNSLRSREKSGHKSRGMELIQKRIAALSHFSIHPISISMSAVFDNESNPGNKCIIMIPSELYSTWHKAHKHSTISI